MKSCEIKFHKRLINILTFNEHKNVTYNAEYKLGSCTYIIEF